MSLHCNGSAGLEDILMKNSCPSEVHTREETRADLCLKIEVRFLMHRRAEESGKSDYVLQDRSIINLALNSHQLSHIGEDRQHRQLDCLECILGKG